MKISRVHVTVLLLVAVMALLVAGFVHRMMQPTIFSQHQMQNYGVTQFDQPRVFREPALTDVNGKPLSLDRFKGKWTLVYFGFTYCPDVCPTTLGILNKFYTELQQKGTADNVQVLLVSVDPARDTAEKLRDYVHYFNSDFMASRGDFLDTQKFAADLNAAFTKVPAGDTYLIDHSSNIVIINPYGHYHGFIKPPFDPVRLRLAFDSVRAQFKRDFGDVSK